jgi:predicted porin
MTAAQADSVQLYGTIDLGVTHFTGLAPASGGASGQTVSQTGLSSGVQSASRIGIKGTENLGGGLYAIFRAETGFCAAGATQSGAVAPGFAGRASSGDSSYCSGSGFMGRQAYVGLTGSFGTFLAGRLMNLAYLNEKAVDPFAMGLTGNYNNVNTELSGEAIETSQTIAYVSPVLAGFSTTLGYAFNVLPNNYIVPATGQQQNAVKTYVAGVNYAHGPLFAAVDYQLLDDFLAPPGGNGMQTGALRMYQLSGGYNFGVVKLTALYGHTTFDFSSGNDTSYLLGATIPLGTGDLLASYDVSKFGVGNPAAPKAKQYAIGYTYPLSKQTNLYGSYARISNDVGADRAVGDATDGFAGVSGQSSTGLAIGIRHNF